MSQTAIPITKVSQVAVNTLYHGGEDNAKDFLKAHNPRLRRTVKRITGKQVDNCLQLIIIHLFADSPDASSQNSPSDSQPSPSQRPKSPANKRRKSTANKRDSSFIKDPSNTAAIVVYSVNDFPQVDDPSKVKYFTLFYEYSGEERRFGLDDIGKTFSLSNFLVVKVPPNRLTAEDDHEEECLEFDLGEFALIAGKGLFSSTVTFEAERPLNASVETPLDVSIESDQLVIDESSQSIVSPPKEQSGATQEAVQAPTQEPVQEAIPGASQERVQEPVQEAVPGASQEPVQETIPGTSQEIIPETQEPIQVGIDVQAIEQDAQQPDTMEFSFTDEESMEEEAFNDATQIGDSDTISAVLGLVSDSVKAGMDVPGFLRNNILLVKFEDLVLKSLKDFEDFGKDQNTVGIMRRLFFDPDKIAIELVDEEDKVRKINIASKAISTAGMQELKLNQLLLIRNKEGFLKADDCMVVDLNDGYSLRLHNLGKTPAETFLYPTEMARVCELMYHYFSSIPALMKMQYPTLCGVVVYKLKHNDSAMEVGLLLSHEWAGVQGSLPRDSGAVYMNQLPTLSKYFKYFSKEVFDGLKTKDIFVNLVLYDDPVAAMDNIAVFTSCIFHGVNKGKKNDLLLRGEQVFRQGKWIHSLSDDCYLVKENWKKLIPLLESLKPTLFEDFSTQMTDDEEVFTNGETEFDITHTTTTLSMPGPSGLSAAASGQGSSHPPLVRPYFTGGPMSFNTQPVFILKHPNFLRDRAVDVDYFSLLTTDSAFADKESVFKVPARLIDFMFTSKNVKFFNLAGFRRESVILICSSDGCHFQAPYEYFIQNIAASVIADKTKMPECRHCHHPLKVHIKIGLTFSDRESVNVNVMLMSPAVERFLKCSELLLMYAPPDDRKFVKALDFLFSSLCSVRHNRNRDFATTSGAAMEQNPLLNLYFRKFALSDPPQERFHPNKEVFAMDDGQSFVFELMALEQSPSN